MKAGIVGTGFVGSTAAYAMVLQGAASEIVLVDVNQAMALAQAEDILHATPFSSPIRIRAEGFEGLSGARVVILACGVGQKPGESRLALLQRNRQVFEQVIPQVTRYAPGAVLVVASNPVDLITQMVIQLAGGAPGRVFGSGTILDTARFRSLLGEHLGVAPQSTHAYVLGEHGDSEVLIWSSARVGGVALSAFAEQRDRTVGADMMRKIDQGVRQAAYRIIEGKKATYFGIGAALSRLVQAIGGNERAVFTVSASDNKLEGCGGVSFSLPRVVAGDGIVATLQPELSAEEMAALQRSVGVLRENLCAIGY